ncbi:MAG: UbiA prenyltransferase family protein [Planctomycetota bacterium]
MPPAGSMIRDLYALARFRQWGKGGFVLIGPFYAVAQGDAALDLSLVAAALIAFVAFGLASSGCYVVNDIRDRDRDAQHPRKRSRPIASGRVSPGRARVFAVGLLAAAALCVWLGPIVTGAALVEPWWVAGLLLLYVLNVMAYTAILKQRVILDVVSLSSGFVLRVLVGCAAVGVAPSTWLLNSTLFLAMFLAFGKRLGERRTMAAEHVDASEVRAVQQAYSDDLLRMAVVMTGVGTLVTYAGYVQDQEARWGPSLDAVAAGGAWGMNWLWLTMLPATYGLLRCIVLLERGRYDDPTELAVRDRGVQLAGMAFVAVVLVLVVWGGPSGGTPAV